MSPEDYKKRVSDNDKRIKQIERQLRASSKNVS